MRRFCSITLASIAAILASPLVAAVVGTPSAFPNVVVVNAPTVVTITVSVPDPAVIVGGVNLLRLGSSGQTTSVIGQLRDDGQNGDIVAGDKLYSLRATFTEPAATSVQMRVSVALRGVLQRVLSPVISVAANFSGTLPLPPDPGPAGMGTLIGIDSDQDGLRDDVQRYIALNYSSSAKTQSAATQLAKAYVAHVINPGDASLSRTDGLANLYAIDCLFYISGTGAAQLITQIESQVFNTLERLTAYLTSVSSIGTLFYQLPAPQERQGRCMVNPNTLSN